MYTNLTAAVRDEDISTFYTAMAMLHDNPIRFRELMQSSGQGNDERQVESIKSTNERPTLFAHVTTTCSCGECYTALARNDRVPWRVQDGKFVNSKHGIHHPKRNCKTTSFRGVGYIYEPLDVTIRELKLQERKQKRDQEQRLEEAKIVNINTKTNQASAETKKIYSELYTDAMKEKDQKLIDNYQQSKEKYDENIQKHVIDSIDQRSKYHNARKTCTIFPLLEKFDEPELDYWQSKDKALVKQRADKERKVFLRNAKRKPKVDYNKLREIIRSKEPKFEYWNKTKEVEQARSRLAGLTK